MLPRIKRLPPRENDFQAEQDSSPLPLPHHLLPQRRYLHPGHSSNIIIIVQGAPIFSQRNSTFSEATSWTRRAPESSIFELLQPEALPRILQPGTMSRALAGILEPDVIVVHVAQNAVGFFASCLAWYHHQLFKIQNMPVYHDTLKLLHRYPGGSSGG